MCSTFLQKFVLRGLNELKPVWDSPEIAHFNAHDFIRVIDRCNVMGVSESLALRSLRPGVNCWISRYRNRLELVCVSFVQKYWERIYLSILATYEVPHRVLNMPPEALKS